VNNTAASEPLELLPVLLLTGFLGSGKTTLLNQLVVQPAFSRTLVLINEFGEIGLDHDLVTQGTDGVVVEMSSGCLCCTIHADLADTLRRAPGRFGYRGELLFDRVVIETTGLADPAPIIHTLMSNPEVTSRYRLDGVITTVDAVNGMATLDAQIESVKQVAMADRLLVTKTDLTGAPELGGLKERLSQLNPGAPQVLADHGVVDADAIFDPGHYNPIDRSLDVQEWLQAEAYSHGHAHGTQEHHHHEHIDHEHHGHQHHHHDHEHHVHDVNRHDARIKALCLTLDEPLERDVLNVWLNLLLRFRGEDFLRVKGIVNVRGLDGPVVIHGVQHVFHPSFSLDAWPSEDRRTRIVFITRDIDEASLRETLDVVRNADTAQGLRAAPDDNNFVPN
tara:strand:+ start:1036 stop:2211 length:1176 start_codon:yes stop_codon:yes gene_type:complete